MKSKTLYFFKFNIFLICLVIVNGIFLTFIYHELHQFDVRLVGDEKITIAYNKEYNDAGFEIYNNKTKIDNSKAEYDALSNVDTSKLGQYSVEYKIIYQGKEYKLTREVDVKDLTPPVIEFKSEKIERNYCTKELPSKIDVTATDDLDGDLTDSID